MGHSPLAQVGQRLARDLPFTLLMAVVATVVSYLANVLIMMFVYDGYAKVPPAGPATGQGNLLGGSIFWFFLSMAVTVPLGYVRAHGLARSQAALADLPNALGRLFQRDGKAAPSHLLGGVAAGMAMTLLVGSWAGAAVGLGLLASLVTALGALAVRTVASVWSAVIPARRQAADPQAGPLVSLLGMAAAFLAALFLPWWARIGVGVSCAIVAAVLSLGGRPPTTALVVLGWLLLLELAPAHAHDGGWWENQGSGNLWQDIKNWLAGGGANVAGSGVAGGVAGGAGAVAGTAAGGAGGPEAPPTTPPVAPPEKPDEVSETCLRLMEKHGAACSQLGGIARELDAAEDALRNIMKELEDLLAFVRDRRRYLKTIREGWESARYLRQMGLLGLGLTGSVATAGMLTEAQMAVTVAAKNVTALVQALGVAVGSLSGAGIDFVRNAQIDRELAAVAAQEEALNEHYSQTWERLGPMQREAEAAVDRLQSQRAAQATEVRGLEAQMQAQGCNSAPCPYLAATRVWKP